VNAFDALTLGEVEEMVATCLDGKPFENADPLQLAGAVMFMSQRKENPDIDWPTFKATIRMGDLKAFSIQMEADELDPTTGVTS